MGWREYLEARRDGMEQISSAGVIGMHMVSGPLVGFAIGYGLDWFFGTGPWLKLIFLVIGIIAGFMNVYEDTQKLLKKMRIEDEKRRPRS